jgi:dTMP kinase
MRGVEASPIIVIEGTDGSGKETQARMLKARLEYIGKKVGAMAFPRYGDKPVIDPGTSPGEALFYVLGKDERHPPKHNFVNLDPIAASLLYAADRRASLPELQDLVFENDIVILDRYFTANQLHQASKIEDPTSALELAKKIQYLETEFCELPMPNLTVFLNLPYDIAMKRTLDRGAQDLSEADRQYQINSSVRGLRLAQQLNWNIINCATGWKQKTAEELSAEVFESLERSIKL